MIEEAFELFEEDQRDEAVDELADIMELLLRIAQVYGADDQLLRRRMEEKRLVRGGFDEGVVLLETRTPTVRESFAQKGGGWDSTGRSRAERARPATLAELVARTGGPSSRGALVEIPLVPPPQLENVPRSFVIRVAPELEMVVEYSGRNLRVNFRDLTVPEVDPDQLELPLSEDM
jgi:hypothetical protein